MAIYRSNDAPGPSSRSADVSPMDIHDTQPDARVAAYLGSVARPVAPMLKNDSAAARPRPLTRDPSVRSYTGSRGATAMARSPTVRRARELVLEMRTHISGRLGWTGRNILSMGSNVGVAAGVALSLALQRTHGRHAIGRIAFLAWLAITMLAWLVQVMARHQTRARLLRVKLHDRDLLATLYQFRRQLGSTQATQARRALWRDVERALAMVDGNIFLDIHRCVRTIIGIGVGTLGLLMGAALTPFMVLGFGKMMNGPLRLMTWGFDPSSVDRRSLTTLPGDSDMFVVDLIPFAPAPRVRRD